MLYCSSSSLHPIHVESQDNSRHIGQSNIIKGRNLDTTVVCDRFLGITKCRLAHISTQCLVQDMGLDQFMGLFIKSFKIVIQSIFKDSPLDLCSHLLPKMFIKMVTLTVIKYFYINKARDKGQTMLQVEEFNQFLIL